MSDPTKVSWSKSLMEAVILAGGKGTRLHPYTSDIPKPLVPVGDRPIIEILLGQLRRAGVTRVHMAVNHLAHLIMAVLGDGQSHGVEIIYHLEDKPLSTVAPLKLIDDLPDDFIVANGDILTDMKIDKLFDFHLNNRSQLTVATHERSERIDFGVVEISENQAVTGFVEKPQYQFAVSMGIYAFNRSILECVPANRAFGFDDLMIESLRQNRRVLSYAYTGYWLDIGRTSDYERAQREVDLIEGLFD
jgi:NDP-sugar pyrophosphorylase family protein